MQAKEIEFKGEIFPISAQFQLQIKGSKSQMRSNCSRMRELNQDFQRPGIV